MIQRSEIRRYVKNLVAKFAPQRVVLFGSYACGKPTEDSDVDLLVIMNHKKRKNVEQAVDIDLQLHRTFPMDILVRKPSEVRKRLALGDMFLKSVLEDGNILYEQRR